VSGATIAHMARALMRRAHLVAVVAALTLALTGCGGGDDDEAVTVATVAGTTESPSTALPGNADGALPPGEGLPLALREQGGSGIEGIATLLSPEGRPLVVQIQLLGGLDVPYPAHIHEGTCAELGDVAFPLELIEGGSSETRIPDLTLQQLQTEGTYAINVHASEEDIETYVACVDIPQQAE
jgi:hypothetical protein